MGTDDVGYDGGSEFTRGENTLVNALIGVAASVLLAFLPFSTALGGVVAGYLEGGELVDGARVGAIAGAISAVPFALLGYLVVGVLGIFSAEFATVGFLVATAFGAFLLCYVVAPFVIGGAIGAWLESEY